MFINTRSYVLGSAIALFAAGSAFLAPRSASASCPGTPFWSGFQTVRVRLHQDLHSQMRHADGTLWTRAELENATEITLSRLNASSGADTPWVFLDTTPSACAWLDNNCADGVNNPDPGQTCGIANTVHIIPSNCGNTWWYTSALGSTSHVIQIQRSFSGIGDMRWTHMSGSAAAQYEDVLLHELGHSLGLGHANGCGGWATTCPAGAEGTCAVMAAGVADIGQYFLPDDTDGLVDLYGIRVAPTESLDESSNLAAGLTPLPAGNFDGHSFFATSSRPTNTATTMTVAGYGRLFYHSPVASVWDWATLSLTSLGSPSFATATGPLGAAQTSTHHVVSTMAARLSADARRWDRRVSVSMRATAGGSWTTTQSNPGNGALGDTNLGGVSSAFDNQSGAVVHAFRSNNGTVLLQSSNAAGTFTGVLDTNIRSLTTPSIACGNAGSGRNCILVTTRPGRPVSTATVPVLQWTEFSWNHASSSWNPHSTTPTVTGLVVYGDPQVGVHTTGSTWEFVVTHQVPALSGGSFGRSAVVLTKTVGAGSFTQWGSSGTAFNKVSAGTSGGVGDYIELMRFEQ